MQIVIIWKKNLSTLESEVYMRLNVSTSVTVGLGKITVHTMYSPQFNVIFYFSIWFSNWEQKMPKSPSRFALHFMTQEFQSYCTY